MEYISLWCCRSHSDYIFDESNGTNFVPMAKSMLYQINRLTHQREEYRLFSPFFQTATFDMYENTVFQGLGQLRSQGKNTAFVNIANPNWFWFHQPRTLFTDKFDNSWRVPYARYSSLLDGKKAFPVTVVLWCNSLSLRLQAGHQQTFTHSLFAKYSLDVFAKCA